MRFSESGGIVSVRGVIFSVVDYNLEGHYDESQPVKSNPVKKMVEYIVNEHIMSGISLLSTKLNVKGGKCFLKSCK